MPSSVNLTRRGKNCLLRSSNFPLLLFPLPSQSPFYIIPIYAIPTPNPLSFIIVLTLKLFCIVLPYLCGYRGTLRVTLPLNIIIFYYTRPGYCSNTNSAHRFRCEDNNVSFMHVQPHYYRVRQMEPHHQLVGVAKGSS